MKIIKFFIALLLITACSNKESKKIDEALNCANDWFKAWELVSKDIFQIKEQSITRFVFFDSVYVYTTSPLTGQGGTEIFRRCWCSKSAERPKS